MQTIIATIKPGDIGPTVANLQDALLALLERQIIQANDAPNRPTLEELQKLAQGLKDERAQSPFGSSTRQLVMIFQIQQGLGDNLYGVVEDKTAARINEILRSIGALDENIFILSGTVQNSNGQPLAGNTVRAFDCDLRKEQLLGEAQTNGQGYYGIRYTAEQFAPAEAPPHAAPDLIVRVYDFDGKELANSPKHFNAGREVTIDLVIAAPALSEWEIITKAVIPLLIGQGQDGQTLPPWELNDQDISFILEETGLDREQVRLWTTAAHMSREAALLASTGTIPGTGTHNSPNNSELADNIEWVLLYGWFRDGQPQDFDLLVRRSTIALLASLDRGAAQNHIPQLDDKAKAVVSQALESRRVVEEIKPARDGEPASLGGALRTMPQSGQLKLDDANGLGAQIVSLLLKEPTQDGSQWKHIRDLVSDDNLFNSVVRTIGLKQLTGGHVPLIEALQLNEVSETAASLADLVRYDRQHWIALTKKHGAPKAIEAETEELRAIRFGQQIAQSIEMMHPGPFVHHRVLSGQIPVAAEVQKPLTEFLTANPGMRIKDGSVLLWLDSGKFQAGGLSEDQIKLVTPELLKIDRVARLVPSLEYVGPMLKQNYESAHDVVQRHSRDVFVNEMRELVANESEAARIFDAAAGVVATTEALVLTYSPRFGGIDLPVMPANVQKPVQAPQGTMTPRSLTHSSQLSANLQRLFGSQDYCECAHGASLYGPAAYLADLLHMLALGLSVNNKTALDVLLERRPDLAEIDLTGDNTDIVLPYIDLVLEILEAPGMLSIPSRAPGVGPVNGFDSSLSNGTVPDAMKNDPYGFAKCGLTIGDDLSVRGPASGPWRIRDNTSGVKYRLAHSMVAGYYDLAIFPQSVASAAKGYRPFSGITSKVVENVGKENFPWKLPFDTAKDEANTWLAHLGATRAEVMQALSEDHWNDINAACEYLDICPAERRIFNAAPGAAHKDWGFVNASITTPAEEIFDPIAGLVGKYDVASSKVVWEGADPPRSDLPEWHALLKNVSLLRSRARLTHRELLNVLETRFVRASDTARLEITGDECNTGKMRLDAMNAALAHRIHIFVRLWRKLGWSTVDLDRAISVYAVGAAVGGFVVFTDPFLRFVANIARLQAMTGFPVAQLLDLIEPSPGGLPLDTTEYWDHTGALPLRTLSRFQQWFDNPTLGKPRQPEFQLNTERQPELVKVQRPNKLETGLPRPRISDHLDYLSAALAVPVAELLELLPATVVCVNSQQIGSATVEGRAIEVEDSLLKEIEIVLGAMTPNVEFSLKVQVSDSETESSFVDDCPAADLQGGTSPFTINATTQPLTKFTYTGSRKYLRCSISSPAGASPRLWIRVRFQKGQSIVSDDLTLANLTALCRYALLRRTVGVPIKELRLLMTILSFGSLSNIDGPEKVLALLDARRSLKTLSLSIAQADELLLGPNEANAKGLDERAAALLTTIRAEDHAIRDESTVADDKRSGLLKSVLTGLGWDERLIADVLGADGLGCNFGSYEAPLAAMPALPAGVELPQCLIYKATDKRLTVYQTILPSALQNELAPVLATVSGDLRAALQDIYDDASRRVALLEATYDAQLDAMPALPTGITLPQSVTYNSSTKRLTVNQNILPSALQYELEPVLRAVSGDLRAALQVIYDEASRRVASLEATYDAQLDAMPALPTGITLPRSVLYDPDTKRLSVCRTILPAALQNDLAPILRTAVSGDLRTALEVISAEATRRDSLLRTVHAWMRAKKLPTHRADLAIEPALKLELPAEWKGRFYYDQSERKLCLVGWITAADKVSLKSFEISPPPTNSAFASTVDALYSASESYAAATENILVTPGVDLSIEKLLLVTNGLEARCGLVLERLLPDWRRQQLHTKLSSTLSQGLGVTYELAEALLALSCSEVSQSPNFEALVLDAQLLTSNSVTKLSRTGFPEPFDAVIRVLVLGNLLSRLKMDATQVPWLVGAWNGLNLTGLPTQRVSRATADNWSALQALSSLITLRDQAAVGVLTLQKILAATPSTASSIAFAPLAAALGCSEDTLRSFASADGLNISSPEWFHDPSQLLRLVRCLELAGQMNMSASLFVGIKRAQLMTRTPGEAAAEAEAEARALRQMALGKSTNSTWTDDERKVLDGIRQRRRDATVDYLIQKHGVLDANDLYGHYLIDPQMNPCMMTSRIKQAISSVQLFIQRCLMNLEPDAPATMIEVKSWEKYYRVWEANRKVLLYPENWIEPELRDDKTPFFDDVVSSLQQGDATSDKAQLAVQGFLEKLTDLSRVDVVATCSSYDDQGYLLVTHIFARTLAEPHTYWYRQFIKQNVKDPTSSRGMWTAWQPVDLDIEGDHLFPFVWQGRLFLFWAIASEKAKEPTNADLELHEGKMPEKYWQLELAWSEFKSGKWSGRKISSSNLIRANIPISLVPKESFYFHVITHEFCADIRVYVSSPVLLSILYFDGNNVRFAQGLVNWNSLGWDYGDPSETPITATSSYQQVVHANMKTGVQKDRPISLPIYSVFDADGRPRYVRFITIQNSVIRATQFLNQTDQTDMVFAAPSAWTLYWNGIPAYARTTAFIQSDWIHRFFVFPSWQREYTFIDNEGTLGFTDFPHLHFYALDWPQATRLRKTFSEKGIDKLLSFDAQVEKLGGGVLGYFHREYEPTLNMRTQFPSGDLEFSPHSATAQYNWELFFHAPFSIACNLSKNQRFEEARRWFHYIFDPTDNTDDTSVNRYWRFRPFREAGQGLRIDELVRLLADSGNLPQEQREAKSAFEALIAMWKEQPFQPHLVARMRIRSYMYVVVMKYIDNLIAWGDQLFRRETLEALNEATQLYILAAQILGRRPEGIPRRTRPVLKSFSELYSKQRDDLDDLSNALVEAENLIPATSSGGSTQSTNNLKSLYFCVPNNPKLLEYYDRVEDRLFKLRNCMNIDGVVRHLPLFEPAIDPSLLVRAAAAGVDVSAVLADLNAPLSFYRFNVMSQKATELCSEVKGLGAALLGAIEKGDAETMALMRSSHELQMLQNVRMVKELQLHEAKANIDAIGVSLESAQKRFTHYVGLVSQMETLSIPTGPVGPTVQSLALAAIEPLTKIATFVHSSAATVDPIAAASMEMIKQSLARTAEALSATLPAESSATDKVPMNAAEKRQLSEQKSAHDLQRKAMDQRLVAQVLAKIPDFTLGAQGWTSSPVVQLTLGGTLLSSFANFSASILDTEASEHSYRAGLHSTLAGYQRRAADWLLQAELAGKEIEQITKQIAASNLRIAIASQELRNHDLQAENAHAVDEFMHSKYSNRELYSWMSGQLSSLYFQSYQLAYDVAKRAERCFKHELGVDGSFIKFGYWDNLKKGLLAGENLLSDLKRMEVAYLNQNARELEITKHVSLRQLDPQALLDLRRTGRCEFSIPEMLFDLDFPGHYFRRIKSVSVSVPCVVGPYVGVTGTLRLMSSKLRDKAVVSAFYQNDANYRASYLPTQAIATSTGQNDSGLFELNFRDERYLPFEGAGAISSWEFELPSTIKAFDYDTIADLILHVRYTARDGGQTLATPARGDLDRELSGAAGSHFVQLISAMHDFPQQWTAYRAATSGPLILKLTDECFPYLFRTRVQIVASEIGWYSDGGLISGTATTQGSAELSSTIETTGLARSLKNAYALVSYRLRPKP